MEPNLIQLQKTIDEQSAQINEIKQTLEKTRKYFLVTAWVTVLAIIVPLIGLMFIGPSFIGTYIGVVQDSGQ